MKSGIWQKGIGLVQVMMVSGILAAGATLLISQVRESKKERNMQISAQELTLATERVYSELLNPDSCRRNFQNIDFNNLPADVPELVDANGISLYNPGAGPIAIGDPAKQVSLTATQISDLDADDHAIITLTFQRPDNGGQKTQTGSLTITKEVPIVFTSTTAGFAECHADDREAFQTMNENVCTTISDEIRNPECIRATSSWMDSVKRSMCGSFFKGNSEMAFGMGMDLCSPTSLNINADDSNGEYEFIFGFNTDGTAQKCSVNCSEASKVCVGHSFFSPCIDSAGSPVPGASMVCKGLNSCVDTNGDSTDTNNDGVEDSESFIPPNDGNTNPIDGVQEDSTIDTNNPENDEAQDLGGFEEVGDPDDFFDNDDPIDGASGDGTSSSGEGGSGGNSGGETLKEGGECPIQFRDTHCVGKKNKDLVTCPISGKEPLECRCSGPFQICGVVNEDLCESRPGQNCVCISDGTNNYLQCEDENFDGKDSVDPSNCTQPMPAGKYGCRCYVENGGYEWGNCLDELDLPEPKLESPACENFSYSIYPKPKYVCKDAAITYVKIMKGEKCVDIRPAQGTVSVDEAMSDHCPNHPGETGWFPMPSIPERYQCPFTCPDVPAGGTNAPKPTTATECRELLVDLGKDQLVRDQCKAVVSSDPLTYACDSSVLVRYCDLPNGCADLDATGKYCTVDDGIINEGGGDETPVTTTSTSTSSEQTTTKNTSVPPSTNPIDIGISSTECMDENIMVICNPPGTEEYMYNPPCCNQIQDDNKGDGDTTRSEPPKSSGEGGSDEVVVGGNCSPNGSKTTCLTIDGEVGEHTCTDNKWSTCN